jgi:protein-S-isoprenylcysteine O-methyltransferase Ste14
MAASTLQFQHAKSPSIAPKVAITIWYLVCISAAVWVTFFARDTAGSPGRQAVLLACAMIFVVRAAVTFFAFMNRRIPWWEAAWGGGSIGLVLFFMLRAGLRTPQPLGLVDIGGILLYGCGSYLGTASEYSRHVWKARLENQGHLYTGGLFRYSRHINYFGDLLLFGGLGILARQLWAAIVPLVMLLNFIFIIIPAHDAYLATRYGGEFDRYARYVKRLIPFIY